MCGESNDQKHICDPKTFSFVVFFDTPLFVLVKFFSLNFGTVHSGDRNFFKGPENWYQFPAIFCNFPQFSAIFWVSNINHPPAISTNCSQKSVIFDLQGIWAFFWGGTICKNFSSTTFAYTNKTSNNGLNFKRREIRRGPVMPLGRPFKAHHFFCKFSSSSPIPRLSWFCLLPFFCL